MKNISSAIFLSLILILSGCATTKILQPINGSKADGTVTLGYESSAFENPQVDWDLAKATAKSRCMGWGYGDAEAFGGQQSRDTLCSPSGVCYGKEVYITYQCTKAGIKNSNLNQIKMT